MEFYIFEISILILHVINEDSGIYILDQLIKGELQQLQLLDI